MKKLESKILLVLLTFVVTITAATAQTPGLIEGNESIFKKHNITVNEKSINCLIKSKKGKIQNARINEDFINISNSKEELATPMSPKLISCSNPKGTWVYFKNLEDYLKNKSLEERSRFISSLIGIKIKFQGESGECEAILWYDPNDKIEDLKKVSDDGFVDQTESTVTQSKVELLPYPNPLKKSILNCKLTGINEKNVNLNIFALNGQNVYSRDAVQIQSGGAFTCDLSGLANGVYVISVSDSKGSVYSARLIISK